MRNDLWSLENEWLNKFSEAFVRDTHRMVRDVAIDIEDGCVQISGHTRSYYATQLAIHCIQTFNRDGMLLPMTRLSLQVNHHPIELRVTHQIYEVRVAEPTTQVTNRRRGLTRRDGTPPRLPAYES